ncbi:Crp/Fnr family transcriptional regulator [Chroococcidiopsis sp. FACHB-1243]|uniref:Crp/Fnr family transcriptional regulator n=1 Tax=Chroococcidiopsis sp. [FACHB-1243] TaxID=2692781 RepID=UPI0017831697|nr:Crp/Fnr family transcriptional regulator [Chroococcidiopsis sp. [FACHB-1243]]MBD2309359.1 Crp/Fnr family transcriptional regulator [Chroococcidiopsis sp. [FACHB-1243]]
MSASNPPPIPAKNRLLAALPVEEYEALFPHLEQISLTFKQSIYQSNEPLEYIYFPSHGIISLVVIMEDGGVVEAATVGNEGMVGLPVFLEADTIPSEALVQIPGNAMRMKADAFKAWVEQSQPLQKLLKRYTQVMMNSIMQTAACNRIHEIEQRCCRWLLMTHDRVGSDNFPLTQEFLAQMLGVRRPSVSVVASILQKAGLIRYSRGKIAILDRPGLESATCECHRVIKQEFDRLLG